MKYLSKAAILLVLSVALIGCNVLAPVKSDPINYYTLDVLNKTATTKARPSNQTVLISSSTAAPGYGGTGLAYMERQYQLEYFAENRWLEPPAKMMVPLVVESLQSTGRFKAVEVPPYLGAVNVHLKLTLVHLYQDFIASPVTERVAVRASLINSSNGKLLGTKTFDVNEAVPSNDPYGGVKAANAGMSKILDQLAGFVVAASTKAS